MSERSFPDRLRLSWPWAVVLAPPVLYLALVLWQVENIPHADDFDAILRYLGLPTEARDGARFGQHNEHRPVTLRGSAEVLLWLTGRVDFSILVAVGTVALLGFGALLLAAAHRPGTSAVWLAPASCLVFLNPSWENMTWASGALSNYGSLFLSLLALVCFGLGGFGRLGVALAAATVAVWSTGTGLVACVVLAGWAACDALDRRDRTSAVRLLVVLAVVSVVLWTYFGGYGRPGHHPGLGDVLRQPVRMVAYLFVFLGSYMQVEALALVAGLGSASALGWLTLAGARRWNPTVYYLAAFLFLNAAAAAATRSGLGLEQALSSRYSMFAASLVAALYLLAVDPQSPVRGWLVERRRPWLALLAAFCAASLVVNLYFLQQRRSRLVAGAAAWPETAQGLSHPDKARAAEALERATTLGIYELPDASED
ncbi:MAG: hypothetical protein AAGN66_02450 [Acidobacteriota bacterium]